MTLKNCTKAELLEIIQELEINSSSTAITVQFALGNIARRRADEKSNKAKRPFSAAGDATDYELDTYGKTWISYRRKPEEGTT